MRRPTLGIAVVVLTSLTFPSLAGAAPEDPALCSTVGAGAAVSCESWRNRYDGPGGIFDQPMGAVLSPDGRIAFVTGFSNGDASKPNLLAYDIATRAYDTVTGADLWTARYDGPGHGYDAGTDLEVSSDGQTVYVSGHSQGATTGADLVLIAYEASTGAQRWIIRSDFSQYETTGRGMTLSPDGSRIYLAGTTYDAVSGWDFTTVAYNASDGEVLWVATYAGPGVMPKDQDGGLTGGITTSADGSRVYVTGESSGAKAGQDYATVAYAAATGDELWVSRYSSRSGANDLPGAVVASPDGRRVYVTGAADGNVFPSTSWDYTTISYDAATGAEIWIQRYQGPADFLWGDGLIADSDNLTIFMASGDLANSMALSPDGSTVYVTGYSTFIATQNYDFATVAYDAKTGDNIWTTRYDGPLHGNDSATGLTVSPDGSRVYVIGASTGVGGYDYATVSYDAATGRPTCPPGSTATEVETSRRRSR